MEDLFTNRLIVQNFVSEVHDDNITSLTTYIIIFRDDFNENCSSSVSINSSVCESNTCSYVFNVSSLICTSTSLMVSVYVLHNDTVLLGPKVNVYTGKHCVLIMAYHD